MWPTSSPIDIAIGWNTKYRIRDAQHTNKSVRRSASAGRRILVMWSLKPQLRSRNELLQGENGSAATISSTISY